jgi:hypothetical protein
MARDAKRPTEGLPPARYPVSKTGGLTSLGGSTPSPSAGDDRPRALGRRSRPPARSRRSALPGVCGSTGPPAGRVCGAPAAAQIVTGQRARGGAPRVPARSTPGRAHGGMAELARQRVASASATSRRSQVRVLLPPLHRCDVVQSAGRPAVTRRMLVRAQPSQLTRPGLLADRGCRPLKPATRVRIPLGALVCSPLGSRPSGAADP